MDVRLSPEQQALRDAAVQVVDRLGAHAVGELDDAERVAKLDAAVAASGWRDLRAPADESPGASAAARPLASGVEVAIVAEELGRGLADTPFLGPTLAAELRRLAGAPPAPAEATETVVLTADLGAVACTVGGITPAGAVAVDVPRAHDDDGRHTGAPVPATALVLLPTSEGYALGLIDLAANADAADQILQINAAVERRPVAGGGGLQATARSDLTRPVVVLGHAAPVAPVPGQARALTDDDLTRVTALGLAASCADLVGTMAGAVRLATGYAKERRQYGVPVGSFQAVQHLLADALVSTEGSRSVTLHAAWAVDALPPAEALAAASVAKAYCARAARTVCETAIQVHGGIGNTWECLTHVFLRRSLLSSDLFGGVGPSLARVLGHHGIEGADGLR